jgi:hypothetical protein
MLSKSREAEAAHPFLVKDGMHQGPSKQARVCFPCHWFSNAVVVNVPPSLLVARYIMPKGYIAIDGTSLTVGEVS